jgi:hypothetical protein
MPTMTESSINPKAQPKGTAATSQPALPCSQITWGIIRYAGGSGHAPDEDAAAFDGWYTDRNDALAIARDWAARFPQWIVALVRSDLIWFGDGDFGTVRDRALTYRENIFKNGHHDDHHT